ncbi:MAG TPA: flagellar basal body rod protein FlgC [Desulfohalobiaceae bacterium]|nr:flagellar basal body rod protein FlgC [Desulfohalobiaceae bacterium]
MNVLGSMYINATALKAETTRLNTISANLANIDTTRTPEGGPYRKKSVVFRSAPMNFEQSLEHSFNNQLQGVQVDKIVNSPEPLRKEYDPSHPDAGPEGYVEKPNIKLMEEVTDMKSAVHAYELNVTAIKTSQRMATQALKIGA